MYADLDSLLTEKPYCFPLGFLTACLSFYCGKTKILNFNLIYMKDMKDAWSGVLTICMEKPEIPVGNQMVCAISFGKLQKMWLSRQWGHFSRSWAVIGGDETFLLFSVCSTDLDILCGSLISHQVKFYSFMFMQKISTQVVCVNAKPSRFPRVN